MTDVGPLCMNSIYMGDFSPITFRVVDIKQNKNTPQKTMTQRNYIDDAQGCRDLLYSPSNASNMSSFFIICFI